MMIKRILCIALFYLNVIWLHAQNVVLPIVNHEVIMLGSRSSTLLTGKQAQVVKFELPVNTVRWYYRFYNITKKEQLPTYRPKRLLMDDVTKSLTSHNFHSIEIPKIPTSLKNKLNVYLLRDSNEVASFTKIFSFQKAAYQGAFSSLNAYSGWVEVCDPQYITGLQYLGLMNLGNLSGTNVVLDVIAICKKRANHTGWSEADLKAEEIRFVKNYKEEIPPTWLEKSSDCYLNSLQSEMTFAAYKNLNVEEKHALLSRYFQNCYDAQFTSRVKDTLTDISIYTVFGDWKTERNEMLKMDFTGELKLTKRDGKVLKGIWYLTDENLILKFNGYEEQRYEPIVTMQNKYVWRNKNTGKYLRYLRVNSTD